MPLLCAPVPLVERVSQALAGTDELVRRCEGEGEGAADEAECETGFHERECGFETRSRKWARADERAAEDAAFVLRSWLESDDGGGQHEDEVHVSVRTASIGPS